MAYDAGTEAGQIPVDEEWHDQLVAQNSVWSVADEFVLEPEGSEPPMKTLARVVDVTAGQVLRSSQPGERGNIVDVMFRPAFPEQIQRPGRRFLCHGRSPSGGPRSILR